MHVRVCTHERRARTGLERQLARLKPSAATAHSNTGGAARRGAARLTAMSEPLLLFMTRFSAGPRVSSKPYGLYCTTPTGCPRSSGCCFTSTCAWAREESGQLGRVACPHSATTPAECQTGGWADLSVEGIQVDVADCLVEGLLRHGRRRRADGGGVVGQAEGRRAGRAVCVRWQLALLRCPGWLETMPKKCEVPRSGRREPRLEVIIGRCCRSRARD